MSRVDAIAKTAKESAEGSYGVNRAWYIDKGVLEKLGMDQYKAKQGANFLRIIPPENPDEYFGKRIFVHYNIGPNSDAYLCPKLMKNERCPICERRDALMARDVEKELLKAYSCFPPRYLFFAVDVSSKETEEKGAQLYDAPQGINDEILGLSKDRRTGQVIDISDPDKGKVLIFDRKGTKAMNTRYSAFELEDGEAVPDGWLDIPLFDQVLKFAPYEEMEKAMVAMSEGRPQEPEEPEERVPDTPRRRDRGEAAPAPVPASAPAPTPPPTPAAEEPVRRRRRLETPAEAAPVPAPVPAPVSAPVSAPVPAAPVPAAAPDDVRARVRARLAQHRQG